MFKKLKGTFQTAQQDLVDGLKALTILENQPRHEQLQRDINLNVGANVLHRYQEAWSAIQVDNKDSAIKAEELSLMVLPLFKSWDCYTEMMNKLETEVRAIPFILSTLQQSQALLEELQKDFAIVETSMDMLENLCEELDQKKHISFEKQKLSQYKTTKLVEAEKIKVELAHRHAKKMAELESVKLNTLHERAEAFTSAFQEDLDYYKTHGHPHRVPTEFPKVTSLSEIVLEEDRGALDSFLGPDTERDYEPGGLELSGEGTYIEDDYTTEYTTAAVKQDDGQYGGSIDQVIQELKLTVDVDLEEESDLLEERRRHGGEEEEEVTEEEEQEQASGERVSQSSDGGEIESSPGASSRSKDSGIDDTDSVTKES